MFQDTTHADSQLEYTICIKPDKMLLYSQVSMFHDTTRSDSQLEYDNLMRKKI